MGLFGKHAGNKGKHSVTTVIAQGCSANGSIRLNGDIQVDGYIEGKIVSDHTLVISVSGRIKGEVTADKVIINGLFDGECYANSVEILPQGKAHGVIHCDDLSIERGGSFLGKTLPTSADQVVSLPKGETEPSPKQPLENKANKG
ncbi:bactofilin family protein [Rheinheimera baltica]|uniref:bactofilin family protein n=1 Tax=Rheinheimera baltica TaxID=67576 RepID=UPI00273F603B|nr:polymer-forming cytoskeletal protein [Rheinheimera baltica]MDP5151571.1 polymer-forming cytoskeletal protein [Rheinheimera baltica]